MRNIPFAVFVGGVILIAGVLAVNAADAPRTNPADCVAQYFQLCPNVPQNESAVRACIDRHRASFPPSCLELAKGFR